MGEFQGNDKTEDVGPLPLLIVSPKRTWRKGTGNTTRTAGPELDMQDISPAICHQATVARIDLFPNLFFELPGQSKLKDVFLLHNPCAGIRILNKHSVNTYKVHIYITNLHNIFLSVVTYAT